MAKIDPFYGAYTMVKEKCPGRTYHDVSKRYPEVISAMENLGITIRNIGPLDKKTSHLIQLVAAAASQSEGAVHSHTRRALKAGATREEIYHSLLLLIPTGGFPKAMAAISWCRDVLEGECGE